MPWPKTTAGTTDWEVVFETPESGLIALVESATTVGSLEACATLLIQQLFTRKNDADIRRDYTEQLGRIIGFARNGDGGRIEDVTQAVVRLLHAIKDERKQRAADHQTRRSVVTTAEKPAVDPAATAVPDASAEAAFADVLCAYMDSRFAVMQDGINPDNLGQLKIPFMLSAAFRKRFGEIIRGHFAVEMARASRMLVSRAADLPPEQRRASLTEAFDRRRSRNDLWMAWQTVWDDLTTAQKLPAKPKVQKKSLSLSLSKMRKKPSFLKNVEMTPEQWKTKSREIKQANERAVQLWADITAPSDHYVAPTDDDWQFLKEMFARSVKGFETQFNALRQIIDQGGDVPRVFDAYLQSARNVDVSLLATVYKLPEQFLAKRSGLKRGTMLAEMLSRYDADTLAADFPFTWRYLSGLIRPAPPSADGTTPSA